MFKYQIPIKISINYHVSNIKYQSKYQISIPISFDVGDGFAGSYFVLLLIAKHNPTWIGHASELVQRQRISVHLRKQRLATVGDLVGTQTRYGKKPSICIVPRNGRVLIQRGLDYLEDIIWFRVGVTASTNNNDRTIVHRSKNCTEFCNVHRVIVLIARDSEVDQ